MIQHCPGCGVRLDVRRILAGSDVTCPKCHRIFTVAQTVELAKPRARVRPTKSHSIYAWFVGLPCGVLLVALALLILVPLAYGMYDRYQAVKRAERAASEAAAEAERQRRYQRELEQERLRQQGEEARRRQEQEHERTLKEEERKKWEAWERDRKRESDDKARQEREEREANERAAREKREQDERARNEERQRQREEAARIEREREQTVQRDHDEILAYMQNLPVYSNLTNQAWYGSVRRGASTENPSKEGRLHCLQGEVIRGGGDAKRAKVTLYYYFLINDLGIVAREKFEGGNGNLKTIKLLEGNPFDR